MRTTLDLDPELLNAAKRIAAARDESVGKVVSDLALQALRSSRESSSTSRGGFPTFKVPKGARVLTPEDLRRDEDLAK